MLAGLMNTGSLLFARSLILRELGIEASGHFRVSWTISITYLGFMLGAKGTDYYSRLTAAVRNGPHPVDSDWTPIGAFLHYRHTAVERNHETTETYRTKPGIKAKVDSRPYRAF